MIWNWLHRHPRLIDFSIVGFLLIGGVGTAIRNGHHEATAVVLSVAEVAPLLVRRRHPFAVVAAVTAVALAMIALGVFAGA